MNRLLLLTSVPSLVAAGGTLQDDTALVQARISQSTAYRLPWDHPLPSNSTPVDTKDLELVISSFCESTAWLRYFQGPVSIYNKGGQNCRPDLNRGLSERSTTLGHQAGRARVIDLPNVGREGQSYLQHIVDNYDNLAPWTAFAQGSGEHNGVKVTDKLGEFMYGADAHAPVIPIVHRNDNGFILYRDADPDEHVDINYEGLDTSNVYVFPPDGAPVADKARGLFMSLFGGSACEAPPMVFSAGAQFIVSREAIRSKPLAFWQHVATQLKEAKCEELGYVLERVWLFLFDPNIKAAADLQAAPDFCAWSDQRLKKNRGDCNEFRKSMLLQTFVSQDGTPWSKFKTLGPGDR